MAEEGNRTYKHVPKELGQMEGGQQSVGSLEDLH